MTSRREYRQVPLEDIEEIDLSSPTRERRKHPKSSASYAVQTPRLRRIGLFGLFCISLAFFFRLGGNVGPRGEAGRDLSQPPKWGLIEDSLRQARMYPLRFSVLQGAVRSQASTYRLDHLPTHFIELLTFLEEPIKEPRLDRSHSLVSRLDRIRRITCDLALAEQRLTLNISANVRTPSDLAMLIQCPIPDHWIPIMGLDGKKGMPRAKRLDLTLTLWLTETNHVLQFDLPMQPYHPILPEPHQVGICTFPFDSRPINKYKALEWREHHRLLGMGPVHWYARDELLHPLVFNYANERKVQDSFRFAHQVSPEVFNSDLLADRGIYADQTLWMIDCLMRSSYRAPTPYMTFLTLDELFLPVPMPSRQQRKEPVRQLMASRSEDVAALQIWPTYPLGPRVDMAIGNARPLYIQELGNYRAPQEQDSSSQARTIHRTSHVEIPTANGVAHLYRAGTATELLHDSPVWLLNAYSGHMPTEPTTTFQFTAELRTFAWALINATREIEHLAAD